MAKRKNRRSRRASSSSNSSSSSSSSNAGSRRGSKEFASEERSDEQEQIISVELGATGADGGVVEEAVSGGEACCGPDGACQAEKGDQAVEIVDASCAGENEEEAKKEEVEDAKRKRDECCGGGGKALAQDIESTKAATSCCSDSKADGVDTCCAPKVEQAKPQTSGCCGGQERSRSEPPVASSCGLNESEPVSGCCSKTNQTTDLFANKETKDVSDKPSKRDTQRSKAGGKSCCSSKESASGSTGCCGGGSDTDSVSSVKSSAERSSAPRASCCASEESTASAASSKGCCSAPTNGATASKGCCSSGAKEKKASGCSGKADKASTTACCSSVGEKIEEDCEVTRPSIADKQGTEFSQSFLHRVLQFKKDRGAAMAATSSHLPASKRFSSSRSSSDMVSLKLCIGGMTCNGCCTRIESFMLRKPGIAEANVSLLTSRGVFTYDPRVVTPHEIENMVTGLGFKPALVPNDENVSIVLLIDRANPVHAKELLEGHSGIANVTIIDDPSLSTSRSSSSSTGRSWFASSRGGDKKALLVDYDPIATGARSIVHGLSAKLGFQVQATSPRPKATEIGEDDVRKFAKLLAWSCALTLPVVIMEFVLPLFFAADANPVQTEIVRGLTVRDAVGLICATPIEFWIAASIHESAYSAIRHSSRVTMDVLISLSSFTAYAFSVLTIATEVFNLTLHRSDTFFEVTAMLITLILLGRYIEKLVKAKASSSVDALLRIQAKTAILLEQSENLNGNSRNGKSELKETYIDIVLVERQDLLKVVPGARIPTDGIVVEGASSVDESMLTGESRKVAKEPGSTVIGGTVNSQGVLIMRVTHTVTESMLARIVNLVDEAQSSKCVNQSIADGVASYFTTFIILMAVGMFFVWYHLAREGAIDTQGWAPFPFALRFAITILVISCPCAISLAVPTAILVGTTIGSHYGVLFKGGQALEALEGIDVVMFDKTGTLTSANLSVENIVVDSQTLVAGTTNEVWSYMAAAEQSSEHGIGKAIVLHTQRLNVPVLNAHNFQAVPGCGVQCQVDGDHVVAVGSLKWLQNVLHIAVPAEFISMNDTYTQHEGSVVVFCAVDGILRAAVALKDTPRFEAPFVVEHLRREKIQTWVVTGDQRNTALAVAEKLRIPEFTVLSDTLPHQKVEKVRLLQSIGKKVAFVGDGVNDGPALAMANVGVAIGAGTDVAIEAADVVLVKDDLRDLLNAQHLSRATNRMIRWNFTWAFLYNITMMPIACGALYPWFGIAIPPALAGLSELLSSVPVILFSLLLNFWRPPFSPQSDEANDRLAHGRGAFVAIDVADDAPTKKPTESTPLLTGAACS